MAKIQTINKSRLRNNEWLAAGRAIELQIQTAGADALGVTVSFEGFQKALQASIRYCGRLYQYPVRFIPFLFFIPLLGKRIFANAPPPSAPKSIHPTGQICGHLHKAIRRINHTRQLSIPVQDDLSP